MNTGVNPTALRRSTPAPTETEVDDSVLVFAAAVDEVLVLNSSAAAVWRATTSPTTADEVVARLAAVHGVSPGVLADDVRTTLERFVRAGLLEPGPTG